MKSRILLLKKWLHISICNHFFNSRICDSPGSCRIGGHYFYGWCLCVRYSDNTNILYKGSGGSLNSQDFYFIVFLQAVAAQKFREQQELERRKHIEQMRFREQDKLNAVAERRRAIEAADRERKEAMLKKAQEREEKILEKKRLQQSQMSYAFGSSTPRTLHPTLGSTTDLWGGARRYGF